MINLDGEYGGDAPMRFENLHQHIEFYANTDEIDDAAILGPDNEKREAGIELVKEYEKIQDEDTERIILKNNLASVWRDCFFSVNKSFHS